MDYKYDAFISYRHAEKDTLIASEIQKGIERFNIPASLRKKTGKDRFNRVFRDVEELPITSNLTEELEEALKSSQYLIVICSYRTSESDWVKREIDTFLEFHDYNKQLIFTVLVEGEPDEVIPEILRHDNITHYLADGTFYCKDEIVEPLSADYRMPLRKARKIELPRLAAAMLGCNYDEIIRRRKAYKRTRLLIETLIVSAAAIVLMVYIGWMLMRIQDGLRKAQMNQSRYLSTESQKMLEDGDRIGALQLALAALENSDGTRRPITSEALYALSQSVGSYISKGTNSASPVWQYDVVSSIVSYGLNYAEDRVAILDASGKLYVYNAKDHTQIKTLKDDENKFLDFRYDKNDNLLIVTTHGITLYDSNTWAEIWNYTASKVVSPQKNLVAYYRSKGYIILNLSRSMAIINAENGELIKEIDSKQADVFTDANGKQTAFTTERFIVNDDFSKLLLVGSRDSKYNSAYVCDIKQEKWTCAIEESGEFLKLGLDNSGNFLILRNQPGDSQSVFNNTSAYLYDSKVILERVSTAGKSSWKTEIPSMTRVINAELINSGYKTEEGKQVQVVIASFANKFVLIDSKSGKIIKNYDLPDSIVRAASSEESLSSLIVLRNGMLLRMRMDGEIKTVQGEKYFKEGISEINSFADENKKAVYLVEDETKRVITEYSSNFYDSWYKGFEGTESMSLVTDGIRCGKYLVTIGTDRNITCVDLESEKVIWTQKSPTFFVHVLDNGISPDKKNVYLLADYGEGVVVKCNLIKISCEDGKITELPSEFTVLKSNGIVVNNGKIWGTIYESGSKNEEGAKLTVVSYDMTSDTIKKTTVELGNETSNMSYTGNMSVFPDGKKAMVYFKKYVDDQERYIRVTIDIEGAKFTSNETGGCYGAVWSDNGKRFAEASETGVIDVYSADGNLQHSIDTELRIPRKMAYYKDRLYVLYSIGALCSYDNKGKQVSHISLNHGDISKENTDQIKFDFVHGFLFLRSGDNTDIINLSESKSVSCMRGYLGLYTTKEKDTELTDAKVICYALSAEAGKVIGYFEYKTPDKLIQQAKEILNGKTVSEEVRRKYGLE